MVSRIFREIQVVLLANNFHTSPDDGVQTQNKGFEITGLRSMIKFCSFNKRRQRTTAKVTDDGIPVVSKTLRNFQEFVSVGEPFSIQYYVPTAKSLFCQLMIHLKPSVLMVFRLLILFYSLLVKVKKNSVPIFLFVFECH